MKYLIGNALRQARKNAKMKVVDVVKYLEEQGIPVAEKTVYGWENDSAYPSITIFLLLCERYSIENIMETFTQN